MFSSPRRVAVFCGSRFGSALEYEGAARELGASLAASGIELVFGGTDCGLMGVVARSVLEHGGRARGIVPQSDAHFPVAPDVEVEIVASVAHRWRIAKRGCWNCLMRSWRSREDWERSMSYSTPLLYAPSKFMPNPSL